MEKQKENNAMQWITKNNPGIWFLSWVGLVGIFFALLCCDVMYCAARNSSSFLDLTINKYFALMLNRCCRKWNKNIRRISFLNDSHCNLLPSGSQRKQFICLIPACISVSSMFLPPLDGGRANKKAENRFGNNKNVIKWKETEKNEELPRLKR